MPELIDPETCSWCTEEVEDSELRDVPERWNMDGRICSYCFNEEQDKRTEYGMEDDYYYL